MASLLTSCDIFPLSGNISTNFLIFDFLGLIAPESCSYEHTSFTSFNFDAKRAPLYPFTTCVSLFDTKDDTGSRFAPPFSIVMEILPFIPYLFVITLIILLNIYFGGTRVSFLTIILKFTDSPLLSNKAPSLSLSKVDS